MVREVNIETTDTIFNKALQILGYADNLDIIARDVRYLNTSVDSIVGAEDDMGLQINISKAKYMFSTRKKKMKDN